MVGLDVCAACYRRKICPYEGAPLLAPSMFCPEDIQPLRVLLRAMVRAERQAPNGRI